MLTCTGCYRIFLFLEAVVKVSNHLKSRYIRTRYTSEGEEWPPDQPKYFTSLSLIHHKAEKEVITIAEATQSGNIDGIMSPSTCMQANVPLETQMFFAQSRTSKDVREIFAPSEDGQEPRGVLIEGVPGIGKTVLSKELSLQGPKIYC